MGRSLGIHVAIAADRLGAVPTALASLAQQRLAFQLADVADYAQFGLMRRAIPQFVPGRAVVGGSAQVIQVARTDPARTLAEEVAARAGRVAGATPAEGGPRRWASCLRAWAPTRCWAPAAPSVTRSSSRSGSGMRRWSRRASSSTRATTQ